jgi:hypothetical protein
VAWECAECNAREKLRNPVDAVCHHCGKPLCRGDRVEIADLAFAMVPGPISPVAVHCRSCKRQYHPTDIPVGKRLR